MKLNWNCILTWETKQSVLISPKFVNWIAKIQDNYTIQSITIHAVSMFGSKVGFIYAEADAYDTNGNKIPGIALVRDDSVAILVVITEEETKSKFLAMVQEERIPAGKRITAIPAGMIDGDSVVGASINELKEEIGTDLNFSVDNLTELEGAYPSPGGSDEFVHIYKYEISLSSEKLKEINGRITGTESENESITVKIIPLDIDAVNQTESMFSKLAIYSYLAND